MSEKQTAYLVTCPRCDTRNAYRTSAAGTEVRCEMCHTRFTAPKLVEPRKPDPSRRAGTFSGYGVTGEEPSSQQQSAKQPAGSRQFSLDCSLCGTRMTFREEHVGRQARCPDCYTVLTVPPAPPLPKKPQITPETYGISKEEPPERPNPEQLRNTGYAFIPRPGAGGPLFSDEEVEEMTRPREPRKQEPPPSREEPRRPREKVASGSSSATRIRGESSSTWIAPLPSSGPGPAPTSRWKHEVPATPTPADAFPHTRKPEARQPAPQKQSAKKQTATKPSRAERNAQKVAEQRAREEAADDIRSNPIPVAPALPMLSGIYTTPFRGQSLLRWFILVILLAILAADVGVTIVFVEKFPPTVFYMVAGIVILGLIAGGYAANCIRSIVMDTANGGDDIDNWHDWDWRNWVFSFFQFAIPGMLIFSLGMAIANAIGVRQELTRFFALGVTAILFPINYLSVITENTHLVIVSSFVMRSMRTCFRAWVAFYLQTQLLLVGGFALYYFVAGVSRFGALAVACPLIAAVMFIWARLAGRLLWMAGQAELAANAE